MGLFNFGIGGIELRLEKYEFAPGEAIKGHVSLKLKKPIKARKLGIALLGLQETHQLRSGPSPRRESNYIFNFEKPLDGEKEYLQGEYDFELKIPANVLEGSYGSGALAAVAKTAQFLGGALTNIKWFVEASLDIPMGLDVRKKIQINIG
ncbi:MAG: hypothetical protein HYW05_03665 [Candidatus Diapherotrites archaeon]|nr:hypothetical protein [Candidatus Diapherotrites archaeon]